MPPLNFAGNLLLSSLSTDTRVFLLRNASAVELPVKKVLYEPDTVPRYAYFLLSGLASVVTPAPDGQSAEVGMIGREGFVGSLHLLGPTLVPTRCLMQLSGTALRVSFAELKKAFEGSEELRQRVLECVQQHSATLAQIAGCNRLHGAEQRLIRWLLMAHDQTGYDTLEFTHEYLSEMIATQRSTVTIIAGELQRRGLIKYSRGKVYLVNPVGLDAAACPCMPIVRRLLCNLYKHNSTGRPGQASLAADASIPRLFD